MSQPSSPTSVGSWPTDWHASRSSGTPAARQRRPTAAAGCTSPPCEGTCTSETSRAPRASSSSSAASETWPLSSSADHDDDGPGAPRHLEQRDVVRRVLGAAGQDPVARLEVEGVEGHVPGPGRVLDDRDLVAGAAEQAGDAVVGRLDPVAPPAPPPRSPRSAPRARGARRPCRARRRA